MKKEIYESAGVNAKIGLKNFASNQLIYDRFLRQFNEDTNFSKVMDAYEKKDEAALKESLNALSRIAGKMGMMDLQAVCKETLEALEAGNQSEVDGGIKKVKEQHNRVVTAFA